MTLATTTPTRSHLLELRRQLGFALEGFDLLEQKRQVLTLELVRRLERLRRAEQATAAALAQAHGALREATLDVGSEGLDRLALGCAPDHDITVGEERLIGLRLPQARVALRPPGPRFGLLGTSPAVDLVPRRFAEVLATLGELAALQTAVLRLDRELERTQRRCNALTEVFIPDCRKAIGRIAAALEERERESFMDRKLRGRRSP